MPSVPLLEASGRLLDLTNAGLHHAVQRSVSEPDALFKDGKESLPFPGQDYTFLSRAAGLGNYSSVNASAILKMHQQHTLQIIATANSSVSLIAVVCALYWFCMMRRNFRRDLILLLIGGGFWKSLWFFLFSVVTFARGGNIPSESNFCQAGGYLLQTGFEACDFAILFMSMHMYLQIFPPSHSLLGHDGLYRVRMYVFAAWVIFPNLSAGLAFINPRLAFLHQGAFCSLPYRPFWYKLTLFWIPRYLIYAYVVFVAIKIYRYVGSEFKIFGQERDVSTSFAMPGQSSIDRRAQTEFERTQRERSLVSATEKGRYDDESYAPDDTSGTVRITPVRTQSTDSATKFQVNAGRPQSTPNWPTGPTGMESDQRESASRSNPASRRGSHQIAAGILGEDFAPPTNFDPGRHRGSFASIISKHSSMAGSVDVPPALAPISEGRNSSLGSDKPPDTASYALRQRRRAIQRQLRLLFIYPVVYMLCWIIPSIMHFMSYSDHFAQHPVWPMSIIQTFTLTIMTFLDVCIFSWRERPWRHIPGSDGTFLGSFMWWRYCFGDTWAQERRESRAPSYHRHNEDSDKIEADEKSSSHSGLIAALKRWSVSRKRSSPTGSDTPATRTSSAGRPSASFSHKRTFSGGSDRRHREAEMAHERLALERADYEQNRRSLQDRRASVISQQLPASPDRKEWFDKKGDAMVFSDKEAVKEEKQV